MKPAARPRPVRSLAVSLAMAALASACSLIVARTAAALPGAPAANPDAPAVSAGPVHRADVAAYLADIGHRLEAAASERTAPGGAPAVTADPEFDEIGGDDVLAALEDTIRSIASPSMDIANNGDIFVAVEVQTGVSDFEIHVYRSQDGGRTWQLWGTKADPIAFSSYQYPSVHIAEGNVDRFFLAYQYDPPLGLSTIEVAYADPTLPAAAFTTVTVLASADVDYGKPCIRSDEEASTGYYVHLVAEGSDGDGTDIWYARSRFQGDPWETPYRIATLTGDNQRHYIEPQITYGNNCQVHCAWRFLVLDGSADQAVRYRRATNCVGMGIDDWEPIVYLTPNNNGYHESVASVAASHTTNTALVSYNVRSVAGVREGVHIQASYDAGVTWDPADLQELPDDAYSIHLIAKPNGAGFVHFGGQGRHDNLGFEKSPDVEPVSWSPHQSFQDRLYDTNAAYNASRVGVCDPTRADQVAVVWPVCVDGVKDSLYFDAEWRGGPGFPNLEPGFPLALAAGVRSPLGICELDGDPQSEIVFGDVDGHIQARNHDGTSLSGWPIDIGDIAPDSPVAVGDLDGDGVNEVVCGNTAGVVHAFRADGTGFPGWPVDTGYPDSVYVSIGALTPVSHRQVVACVSNRIFLLSGAGAVQPPFPIKSGGEIRTSAAIGDVNDDGSNEIVMLQYQFMNVITGAGGSQAFRNFVTLGKSFSNAPTLADLDGDGDLEIAAPTDQGDLYVLNPDGTDFPGFPITEPGGRPLSSVAMAQIRGTTSPELVYSVDDATAPRVNARYATGAALGGYPIPTGVGWRLPGQPVLDVLDGGSPDVVVGARDMKAYAWDNFGVALPGWPTELAAQFNTSPASGDIDGDGRVEVVLASWDPPRLVVIDLGAPVVRGGVHQTWYWPMYGYNPERQGCLACGEDAVVSVPEMPGPAGSVRFAPPVPNPSGGPVALAFDLPARAAVTLTVYDVAGRRVRQLVRSERAAGPHRESWDGCDDGGVAMAAGVYYARLVVDASAGGGPLVRKITLLR